MVKILIFIFLGFLSITHVFAQELSVQVPYKYPLKQINTFCRKDLSGPYETRMLFYDRNKRLIKISDINSNNSETVTLYFYDQSGLLISREIIPVINSDIPPQKTTYEYNKEGQLILEREDSLNKTSYSYNDDGKLRSKLTEYPQKPELYTYKYDGLNRLIEIFRNNEKEIAYVYSDNLIIREVHFNKNRATYRCDYKYDYQGLKLEIIENEKIILKKTHTILITG